MNAPHASPDLETRRTTEAKMIAAFALAYGKIPAWLLQSLLDVDRQIQRQERHSKVTEIRGAIRIPVSN